MDENGRIGPFPGWMSLYLTVIAYTALLILLLYLMTVFFDHSLEATLPPRLPVSTLLGESST